MNTIGNHISVIVGEGLEVDLSNLEDIPTSSVEHIRELIEQDILFSALDNITRVLVVEKGKETNDIYENEINDGVSFFHDVDGKAIHVRVS
jgi:hypothetical protein